MAHGLTNKDQMFSVRAVPWHGLGVVLDKYPKSIEEALTAAGLGWQIKQLPVFVGSGAGQIEAKGWKANVRHDTGDVLGIVSDEYEVVPNEEAFKFLDALIGSDMHFETAGSLWEGRRVWCLARLPEYVEMGGDKSATYIYVANSHDGSMAVTAAVTPIRIVCNNTLTAALSRAERGEAAARTYRFRHTGNLNTKFAEARQVMGMTLNYEKQFVVLSNRLARLKMSEAKVEKLAKALFPVEDDLGARAKHNREQRAGALLDIFHGKGPAGDTTGNSPGTAWCFVNAAAEMADWGRRYTKRTHQMQRSFEDGALKQRALDLTLAAF